MAERFLTYDFDFMIDRSPAETGDVFKRAAQLYAESEAGNLDKNFAYGEMPSSDGVGFFPIYASGGEEIKFGNIEKQQDVLFENIVKHLGALGVSLVSDGDPYYHDTRVINANGEEIGIYSGRGISGADPSLGGRVTHWGVNEFPRVDLTKYP